MRKELGATSRRAMMGMITFLRLMELFPVTQGNIASLPETLWESKRHRSKYPSQVGVESVRMCNCVCVWFIKYFLVNICSGSNGLSNNAASPKSSKSNPPSTNGNAIRHNDVTNHKHQSSLGSGTSEDEKKPARVPNLHIPTNLKPDDSKESPTSSISSSMSSHSRISTSSSASRHDVEADDHSDARSNIRVSRRKNMVAPAFLRRLSSTQVLEGEYIEDFVICGVV